MPFRGRSIKLRITHELFSGEQQFSKINYKYERCKHTKTKSCYKNISCWFICSSIFSFFLLCGDLKFDLMFFIQLIWWIRACQIFKKFDQTNVSNFAVYLIKFFCTLPPPHLTIFSKTPSPKLMPPMGYPPLKNEALSHLKNNLHLEFASISWNIEI